MKAKPVRKKNFPYSTDEGILEAIRDEAQMQNSSVNALINKLLTRYVTYYKYIERKGIVAIPNKSFQLMINYVEENVILETIKKNELDIDTLFLIRKIPITFDNFIIYALEGAAIMGGLLHHYTVYKDEQDYTRLILEHNYNIKWYRIMGIAFSDSLKELFNFNTQCIFHPDSVTIKILEKHIIA